MIPQLDQAPLDALNHFYNRFKNRIMDSQNRIEHKSVLLTVLKLPVNELSRLLADSTLSNVSFSRAELDLLLTQGYIRSLDELGKAYEYAITVAGIWYVELHRNEMDINRLLNYFQETKLSFKTSTKPLKDIEKTILFAMIAIRNFSASSTMDINSGSFRDHWIEIFDICTKYLHKIGVVSKEKWNTFRPGNEHSITHVMRRANDLPQKTINLYKSSGNNRYWLNVDNKSITPQKQLFFLYKLILGNVETYDVIDDIYSFCCDIAYNKSKNVIDNFEFINAEWDTILKDALRNLYYGGSP